MLFSIEDSEDLEKLEELVSLENQVKVVRLRDKLGKQTFHEDMKKAFEPVTKSSQDVSEEVTKTITEISIKNDEAIENLSNKFLEITTDRGKIATYLMTPLSKVTNLENYRQFKLVKDHNWNRVTDLLIRNTIPITLHDKLLTFPDTNKVFELKGDLLKLITNKNYNVDLASLADNKLMYNFAKEMQFNVRGKGRESTRDRTLINLLKSPGLIVSASDVSKTIVLSSHPTEICDRLTLLLQEKPAGKNSDMITDEIVAIVDNLLQYKCMSKKEHEQILNQCNLLHKRV